MMFILSWMWFKYSLVWELCIPNIPVLRFIFRISSAYCNELTLLLLGLMKQHRQKLPDNEQNNCIVYWSVFKILQPLTCLKKNSTFKESLQSPLLMTKAEQISKTLAFNSIGFWWWNMTFIHSSFGLLPFLMWTPGITFWKLAPLLLSGDRVWEMHLSGGPLRNSYYQLVIDTWYMMLHVSI